MPDYQQTIDYLFARLPMYSRIGAAAYKGDLDNITKLCNTLGNPQQQLKCIHVAGTNGKGSVSHSIAAILQSAGYKTGLYTSPHLKDFRERIRVNGEMISKDFVVAFTEKLKPFIESLEPSFFEITVGMAFEYFASLNVNVAVIETGLGGRLDSTNIITPVLSVITNIGYDHTSILGNTLQQVAWEKAGIIKKNIPVVIGETIRETKEVFLKKAAGENASILFANELRWIAGWQQGQNLLTATVADKLTDDRTDYKLSLTGLYQLKNLLTILESIHQLVLQDWDISAKDIQHGLLHISRLTGLAGRWQVIHRHPYTVLDVAHNEDGVRQIVSQLEHCTFQKLHIVIGFVKDKEVDKVLDLLPKHAAYYFTRATIPRAMPAQDLLNQAANHSLAGYAFETVSAALQQAVANAHAHDMILVCGSVFIVGEVHEEAIKWQD